MHSTAHCLTEQLRNASMDKLVKHIEQLEVCNQCLHPLVDLEMGDKCPCCGKLTSERELRASTVHSLMDYSGMDSDLDIAEPDSPDMSNSTDRIFSSPPPKRVCKGLNTRGPHVTVRNLSGQSRFAGAQPNFNALTPEDKAAVIKGIELGEDADSVCEEFRQRLLAFGYKNGGRNDGNTFKYPAYLRMFFDRGTFTTRSELFAEGARERAHAAYKAMAHEKYQSASGKTSESKYFRNHCHGFNDFVRLALPS